VLQIFDGGRQGFSWKTRWRDGQGGARAEGYISGTSLLAQGEVEHWGAFGLAWLGFSEYQDLLHAFVDAVLRGDGEEDGLVAGCGENAAGDVDGLEDLGSVRSRHGDLDGSKVVGGVSGCGGGWRR